MEDHICHRYKDLQHATEYELLEEGDLSKTLSDLSEAEIYHICFNLKKALPGKVFFLNT